MLAPLARLTLMVVAALVIAFVDETFEAGVTMAGPEDQSPTYVSTEHVDIRPLEEVRDEQHARTGDPGLTCLARTPDLEGQADRLGNVVADDRGDCTSTFAIIDP